MMRRLARVTRRWLADRQDSFAPRPPPLCLRSWPHRSYDLSVRLIWNDLLARRLRADPAEYAQPGGSLGSGPVLAPRRSENQLERLSSLE